MLISKRFSSFLHSTCSLSVSHQYLALDGIYHLFGLHSQAIRLSGNTAYAFRTAKDGTITLYGHTFPGGLDRSSGCICSSRLQFGLVADLEIELIPVHSPLLRESLLVSFPPLSYMLKFSGSSYLISGPN